MFNPYTENVESVFKKSTLIQKKGGEDKKIINRKHIKNEKSDKATEKKTTRPKSS